MIDFKRLEKRLIEAEGLRLKPYRCTAGKLTIGVGRNLEDGGISREEALHLLWRDIGECRDDLRSIFGVRFDEFSETRQEALIDMRFNLGPGGFRGFKKMIEAIKAGDWKVAASHAMESKWAGQVGRRACMIARDLGGGK